MTAITSAAKGSGYYDVFLEDNSVVRVSDTALPSDYAPTQGDDLSVSADGIVTFKSAAEVVS